MEAMLKIEGGSLKGAALEIAEALVKIIEAKGEQHTIVEALKAFGMTVKIEGVSISDCSFRADSQPSSAAVEVDQ